MHTYWREFQGGQGEERRFVSIPFLRLSLLLNVAERPDVCPARAWCSHPKRRSESRTRVRAPPAVRASGGTTVSPGAQGGDVMGAWAGGEGPDAVNAGELVGKARLSNREGTDKTDLCQEVWIRTSLSRSSTSFPRSLALNLVSPGLA